MDEIKEGYKTTSFGRGIAVDAAGILLAFQSQDWRVQCTALLVVGAINVSYNVLSGRRSEQKADVIMARIESAVPPIATTNTMA
jgi:hypothetical protein